MCQMSMVFAAVGPQFYSLPGQFQCEEVIEMLELCSQRTQLNLRLTGRKDEWHLFLVSCFGTMLFILLYVFKFCFKTCVF